MSRASTPLKVARVALKRVQNRWGQRKWSQKTTRDGEEVWTVCLEGAVTGGCRVPITDAQRTVLQVMNDIICEQDPDMARLRKMLGATNRSIIPSFNDHNCSLEDAEEIVKRVIIRLETGGLDDPEEDYIDDDEVASLLG